MTLSFSSCCLFDGLLVIVNGRLEHGCLAQSDAEVIAAERSQFEVEAVLRVTERLGKTLEIAASVEVEAPATVIGKAALVGTETFTDVPTNSF